MPNNKRTSAPNAVAEADFDPATVNARLWLEAHCLQKSAQLGSVASLPVLAGAALAGRLGRTSPLNTAGAFRVLAASSSLIFVVLAAATSYKVVGLDLEGVQERVCVPAR